MNLLRKSILIIGCVLIVNLPMVHAQKQPFTLKDLRKLVRLSSPRISPNGKEIAVIATRPDWKKDKSKQQIDLINVATGEKRSLTFHREGLSEPRWSPDGMRLAFLAKDSDSKKPQIFVMSMKGGDPVRITKSKTGVAEYAWSPDGQKIAFVAQDTVPNPKEIKHHDDGFKVTFNNYTTRKAVQPWHLWIVSAKGGKAKRLTEGKWSLNTDQGTITPLAWTNNGKSIVFEKFPSVWYGLAYRSTLAEVDTSGGKVKTIVSAEGSGNAAFSKNGKVLAFMRARNGDLNNGNAVYVDINGKIHDATKALARNINNYIWLPDSKSVLMTGQKGTRSVMWRQPISGKAQQLDLHGINASPDMSVSNNGVVTFIGSTAMHPGELYVMNTLQSTPKRLTDMNAFVDTLALGKTDSVSWKGPRHHFFEDGVLTYPVNYQKGRKYPLVLVIHGGPVGASLVNFSSLIQLFAAKGFLVFQPNYRGSINLGDAYQHAIDRNTGRGPGRDVMAGLKVVEKKGIVDTKRIGISGWSYGGYMTSWLNGNYPNKWKAAVEGAALNDWVMDYTIAFYQKFDMYFFGGSPWVKKYEKIWRKQSPIEYAQNVKAPTLIMGDVGDPNVPIVNSYEMYHALLDNGVHVEFYAYPANTHFPHDIVRTTDIFRRWVGWMVKYLKPS